MAQAKRIMKAAALPLLGLGALGACATSAADPRPAADTCRAGPGQAFIGQTASSDTGAALLAATRTRELRWVAPGMMVTMDYRFGRLTVAYDGAMRIVSVSCG